MASKKIRNFNEINQYSQFATPIMQGAASLMNTFGGTRQVTPEFQFEEELDASGMPVYNSPFEVDPTLRLRDARREGNSRMLSSAAEGASIGMKFSPLGAGIGAVAGLGAGLIGKGVRVNKANKAIKRVEGMKADYINNYNTSAQNAAQMLAQREQRNSLINSFSPSIYSM
jgi:hypothetical protein